MLIVKAETRASGYSHGGQTCRTNCMSAAFELLHNVGILPAKTALLIRTVHSIHGVYLGCDDDALMLYLIVVWMR